MGKHKKLQNYHLYLGLGGILAVAALVVALTFGLSSADYIPGGDTGGGGSYTPPPSGSTYTPPPSGSTYTPPPSGSTYTPPPSGSTYTPPPSGSTYTPPPSGSTYTPPPSGDMGTPPAGGTGYTTPPSGSTYPSPAGGTGYTTPPSGSTYPSPTGGTGGQYPSGTQGTYPTPQPGTTGQYPSGQHEPYLRACGPNEQPTQGNPCRVDSSTMRVCGPNEQPTGNNPCRFESTGGQWPSTTPGQQPVGQYGSQQPGQSQPFPQTTTQPGGMGMTVPQPQPYNMLPQQPGQMNGQRPSGDFGQGMQGQYGTQPGGQGFGQQGMQGGQPGGYQQPQQPRCNPDSRPVQDEMGGFRCELIPGFYNPMTGIFGSQTMMRGGPGEQMGRGGPGGPWDEESMQQQQAQQEEQFKKMQEQQVKQIKKELGRMQKEIKRIRKELDKITVTENTPEEIVTAKEALVEIDAAMANVKACSGEECFEIMPEVGTLMGDIMNPGVMDALMRIKEGPRFAKKLKAQLTSIVNKAKGEAKALSKLAGRIKDADVKDAVVAEIAEAAGQCETLSTEILATADEGDIEDAFGRMSELNDVCVGVSDLRWKVDGFLNKQKVIRTINTEVKSLNRQLLNFRGQMTKNRFNGDLDAVTGLANVLPDISSKVDELKKEKDVDLIGDMFDEIAYLISLARDYVEDARVENIANQFDMFRAAPSQNEAVPVESDPQF